MYSIRKVNFYSFSLLAYNVVSFSVIIFLTNRRWRIKSGKRQNNSSAQMHASTLARNTLSWNWFHNRAVGQHGLGNNQSLNTKAIILSVYVSIHDKGCTICDIDGDYALWLGVVHMLCGSFIAAIAQWWKSSLLKKNSHCADGNKSSRATRIRNGCC